jgi:hypothetical protein
LEVIIVLVNGQFEEGEPVKAPLCM